MTQSMLGGGGVAAESIETLWWIMLAGASLIFALVLALVVHAGWRARGAGPGERLVAWLGLGMPVAVLTGLVAYSVHVGHGLATGSGQQPLRIAVEGRQWWWHVVYPEAGAVLANEIRIPVGRPVELWLTSADVIHSFWVPGLAGKMDMTPGAPARLTLEARRAGVWRGQCAEFCGVQHALMAFDVVAMPPEAFAAWLRRQAEPADPVDDRFLAHGRQVFLDAGCGACHAVRGTDAAGVLGPDLTHLGSRLSIGAGTVPTSIGSIQGWIADSQHIKPGNLMPAFGRLESRDLRAVAAWLAQLR